MRETEACTVRASRLGAAILAAVLFVPIFATGGGAQSVLVKTNFPSVVVEPGKSVKFDIDVVTDPPRRVDLKVTSSPRGWHTVLRGGGFVISGVFGDAEAPPDVELEIQVPPEAKAGVYTVVLEGNSSGERSTLPLTLRVSEEAGATAGAVALSGEFSSFRGAATDTITANLKLENNTPERATFALAAEGPRGWQVSARPTAETRAATVTVDGGGEADVEVSIDPPDDTPAETYPVTVTAAAPGGLQATARLSVEVTGNVAMEVSTIDERLNRDAAAGRTTDVILLVRNTGSSPLQDVSLTSTPPTGWDVRFTPERVDQVEPGKDARVVAHVTPAGDAVAGDYSIAVNGSAANGGTADVDLRMTVKTSRFWGLIGLLVIAAALWGLRWVFQTYGRR
jgi:uncharacterized membrane protein